MIVTVTVNPSLDRTYTIGSVVLGQVNRAEGDTVEACGKGVNVSRALCAAEVPTMAVLTAGGSEGEQLRELLEGERLPHALVSTRVPTRTNITVAEPGRTTKMNASGHALTPADYEALVGMVAQQARPARWVVISGSVPPEAPDDLVPRLVTAARAAGARVAVDASGAVLGAAAGVAPDLLAPNADELAELTARPLVRDGSVLLDAALDAAVSVSRRTGSGLLVSLGEGGALWVGQGGARILHAVAPPVIPVNTVGAGDALLAGWLAGEKSEDDAAARLARAVAWGTAACLMPGTAGNVAARADVAAVTITDLTATATRT